MPHDAARLDETRSWLNKASKDLRAAAHDLQAAPPLLEDVDFHCQQAAEKVLKGFLVWHEKPFRKTHSLEEIGEQCLEIDASLKPLIDRVVPLTGYAWESRYPGEAEEPTLDEATMALAIAKVGLRRGLRQAARGTVTEGWRLSALAPSRANACCRRAAGVVPSLPSSRHRTRPNAGPVRG